MKAPPSTLQGLDFMKECGTTMIFITHGIRVVSTTVHGLIEVMDGEDIVTLSLILTIAEESIARVVVVFAWMVRVFVAHNRLGHI